MRLKTPNGPCLWLQHDQFDPLGERSPAAFDQALGVKLALGKVAWTG